MREAERLCAEFVDPVDEMIIGFALTGVASVKEIENEWTIDDFVKGWIFQLRKNWMEEAHTLLIREQAEEARKNT